MCGHVRFGACRCGVPLPDVATGVTAGRCWYVARLRLRQGWYYPFGDPCSQTMLSWVVCDNGDHQAFENGMTSTINQAGKAAKKSLAEKVENLEKDIEGHCRWSRTSLQKIQYLMLK